MNSREFHPSTPPRGDVSASNHAIRFTLLALSPFSPGGGGEAFFPPRCSCSHPIGTSIPMTVWPSDKMDPVLEIWIDDRTTPITMRLHGLLDATTRSPLLSLMDELLGSGDRTIPLIDIKDAYVCEACGIDLLALCQRSTKPVEQSTGLAWTSTVRRR